MAYIPDWLPGTAWKRVVREWGKEKDSMLGVAYKPAKTRIAAGQDQISVVASMKREAEALGLPPNEVDSYLSNTAFSLLVGGTDPTATALLIFTMAMTLFPQVQQRAQKEIYAVVGPNRLPTMKDRPQLAYIERLVQELLRWRPVVPMGLPHACVQDDVYQGKFIPQGTVMAMNHDQDVYKNPETFDPDRFLNPNTPAPPTFGFGGRICPGALLAKETLFLSIASMLTAFTISRAENDNKEIDTMEGKPDHLAYHPKPFKVKLTPRPNANRIIREAPLIDQVYSRVVN
ncbi:cytochrome P450 family protein [Ceratobasidium sp. AG-Ba]|nr:cytochrome P450 family protein [Ceratobasidium sp. AG-Ba]QRV99593.1 cytochrome P450 family protein [Ceratobasidium sp. AG-Ba]QRW14117.1 cytochrome P450 family protein [Ceratobasidium sp. AG-Ba]